MTEHVEINRVKFLNMDGSQYASLTQRSQYIRICLDRVLNEFAKLHDLRAFVPYVSYAPLHLRALRAFVPYAPSCPTCLRALRALIFARLNYAICAVLTRDIKSLIKGNFKMF